MLFIYIFISMYVDVYTCSVLAMYKATQEEQDNRCQLGGMGGPLAMANVGGVCI